MCSCLKQLIILKLVLILIHLPIIEFTIKIYYYLIKIMTL